LKGRPILFITLENKFHVFPWSTSDNCFIRARVSTCFELAGPASGDASLKLNRNWAGSRAKTVALLTVVLALFSFSLYNQFSSNHNDSIRISVAAGSSSREVVVIQLYEEIDQGSADMVQRGVQQAQAANASAVIIDMNTPGGDLSDMLTMIGAINSSLGSGIPVYTYVGNLSSAASAGSYIAMATNEIFMGSGTVIGPSTPYIIGGTTLEEDHVANYTDSLMVSLATQHGRNATAALQMAEFNVAYTGSQAIQYNLANYSGSLGQTLSIIGESGASVMTVSENLTESTISFLSNGTVDGILLLLGIVAIALDFFHPTVVLSIAGGVLIVLALIGAEAIQGPSGYPGLLLPLTLFVAAAALIILEIKTGHGIFLFSGVVIGAIATIFLAYEVPYSPSPIGSVQYVEIGLLIFVGGVLALYARYIGSTIRKKPVTGRESLIGMEGKVYTELTSSGGEVSVEGVVWRAALGNPSDGPIPKGESVIVKQVNGLTLTVDRKP
jgi:membrane-bound serine protease (ClpP class)